jgi:hypothetical protein
LLAYGTEHVSAGLAAELAGLAPSAAEPAADALASAGVLADRRPLRFRHELLRGAVLGEMPAGEQASARVAAVELLRDHHATPERIAAQLLHLEPRGDAAAAVTLREAAAQASARAAPASAAALLRRTLEEPLEGDARTAVLMELGAAEQRLGRPVAAERPATFRPDSLRPHAHSRRPRTAQNPPTVSTMLTKLAKSGELANAEGGYGLPQQRRGLHARQA